MKSQALLLLAGFYIGVIVERNSWSFTNWEFYVTILGILTGAFILDSIWAKIK